MANQHHSAPVRKFGPKNRLAIFHLLQPNSQTDPPQVQHTFGLNNPAPPHRKIPLPFFSLLPTFRVEHPTQCMDSSSYRGLD
jgi:hypothetical protein